jgi:hypothetical protein
MTNEEVLKTILRGEPHLSKDLVQSVSAASATIGPLLLELIRSIRLWHTEEAGRWAVLHAIRLVSELSVKNAVPALIDAIFLASSTRHEDALEDLPVALARKGEAAIRRWSPFWRIAGWMEPFVRSPHPRWKASLSWIPSTRDTVLEILRKLLADSTDLSSIRSHVITILAHFRMPEDLPLIRRVGQTLPLMLDMEPDEIEAYFQLREEPEAWAVYRESLLEYYR